jgi:hypothetical protein
MQINYEKYLLDFKHFIKLIEYYQNDWPYDCHNPVNDWY